MCLGIPSTAPCIVISRVLKASLDDYNIWLRGRLRERQRRTAHVRAHELGVGTEHEDGFQRGDHADHPHALVADGEHERGAGQIASHAHEFADRHHLELLADQLPSLPPSDLIPSGTILRVVKKIGPITSRYVEKVPLAVTTLTEFPKIRVLDTTGSTIHTYTLRARGHLPPNHQEVHRPTLRNTLTPYAYSARLHDLLREQIRARSSPLSHGSGQHLLHCHRVERVVELLLDMLQSSTALVRLSISSYADATTTLLGGSSLSFSSRDHKLSIVA